MQRNTGNGFINSFKNLFNFFLPTPEPPPLKQSPLILKVPPIHYPIIKPVEIKKAEIPSNSVELKKDYSQDRLLEKLNHYLQQSQRKLRLIDGYCNGLTLLWLYKMAEHQEQWFYLLTKKIIDCPDHRLMALEMDIEKLLSHIEWAQNPDYYTRGKNKLPNLNQDDHAKILEVHSLYQNKELQYYNLNKLRSLFNRYVKDEVMITIMNKEHIVGIIRRGMHYYLYDSNYFSGRAKKIPINDLKAVFDEINFCLYKAFNQATDENYIPCTINMMRITRQKSPRLAALQTKQEEEKLSVTPKKLRT